MPRKEIGLTFLFLVNLIILFYLTIGPAGAGSHDSDMMHEGVAVTRGVVDDDVFSAGRMVSVDADVSGDVIVAGRTVKLNGIIGDTLVAVGADITTAASTGGDAFLAGAMIHVSGPVADNLIIVGGRLTIAADIGGKLVATGASISVERDANIGGNAILAGGEVLIEGNIDGDLRLAARKVTILGLVSGDINAEVETLEIGPGAVVAGNIEIKSPNPPVIAASATVRGTVNHIETEGMRGMARTAAMMGIAGVIGVFLFLFGLSTILALAAPKYTANGGAAITTKPMASLGIGVLALVGWPALMALLAVTIIGIPFALIGGAFYAGALLLALPSAVLFLAFVILRQRRNSADIGKGVVVAASLVVLIGLSLVGIIPVVGEIAWFLALCFGLGAGITAIMAERNVQHDVA